LKPIVFSQHAKIRLQIRGATEAEVELAIREGEQLPAERGRLGFRKNFPFGAFWKGRYYESKQVMPIVVEEPERFVVITVYIFYFGGRS